MQKQCAFRAKNTDKLREEQQKSKEIIRTRLNKHKRAEKDQEKDFVARQKQVHQNDFAETPVIEPVSSDLSHKIDDSHVTACTNDVTSESNFEDEAEDVPVTDTCYLYPVMISNLINLQKWVPIQY